MGLDAVLGVKQCNSADSVGLVEEWELIYRPSQSDLTSVPFVLANENLVNPE